MGANFVQIGDEVVVDLTSDSVTPDKLASGVTAHDKSGNKITGTMSARSKTYEITLAKSSGWVLLTTLDEEVLAHINDPNFLVTLSLMDAFEYVYYTVTFACATNTQQSSQNGYPVYGTSIRKTTETNIQCYAMYYPANKTDTSVALGGAQFRVNGNQYYFRPTDGWIHAGTYRLAFTW
jgi:hypothetical protein